MTDTNHPQAGRPLVSVLLPALNCEPYLAPAIESILAQTYTNWEMIVTDDGSTDATRRIAEGYAAADKRIRVIVNETNIGIAATRNRACPLSSGEYIVMQDGDDTSLPDRIERSLAFFDAHPDMVLVGGNWIATDPEGDDCYFVNRLDTDCDDIRGLLRGGDYLPLHPTWMMRRSAFEAAGGYDSFYSVTEDLDLLVRLARLGPIGYLCAPLLRYRGRPGKASYLRRALQVAQHETIFLREEAAVQGREIDVHQVLEERLAAAKERLGQTASPEFHSHFDMGKLYLCTGKRRRAAGEFVRAIGALPWSAQPYAGLALCALPRGIGRGIMARRQAERDRTLAFSQRL